MAIDMEPLLRTHALAIGYGTHRLMEGIAIDAQAGELVALLGVNGIGKSTLLRTLAGMRAPLSGSITVVGQPLDAMSAAERARRVSVVLTGRPSLGAMDVYDLVALGRQPWTGALGRLTAADHAAVEQALVRVGAEHLRARPLTSCSDGECQKVMIARALAQGTPVILLDEPTAFLDLPNRAAIVRVLKVIAQQESKCIIFSSHDLQLALDLCDRVLLMRRNGPLWQGTPAEALASGELELAFAGSGIRFDAHTGTHRFTS